MRVVLLSAASPRYRCAVNLDSSDSPRAPRWPRAATIGALLVGLCATPIASDAIALPPPTALDVPVDGGRPYIKGEKPPSPGARLKDGRAKPQPAPKKAATADKQAAAPRKTPKTPPKTAKKPEKPASKPTIRKRDVPAIEKPRRVIEGPRRRPKPAKEVVPDTILAMLDAGRLIVPRAIVGLASGYDQFPDLGATGVDLALLRPASARHFYGGRLGVYTPTVQAANWYTEAGDKLPMYHDIRLTFVNATFEYAYRRRIVGPVGLQLRFGIGINLALGEVERAEVLPTCERPFSKCPHWRKVGRPSSTLPSPVWPALRASGGLFVNLGDHVGLHLEGGLRDALYAGAGLSFRR